MEKPSQAVCNRSLTRSETDRLTGLMQVEDMEDTFELIMEYCDKTSENDSPAEMYDVLKSIKSLCEEFI